MNEELRQKAKAQGIEPPNVSPICDELHLTEEVEQAAQETVDDVFWNSTINHTPSVLAASAVYYQCLLCNEKREQATVAKAAGVSTTPIRNCYPKLAEHQGIEIRRHKRNTERTQQVDESLFGAVRRWVRL